MRVNDLLTGVYGVKERAKRTTNVVRAEAKSGLSVEHAR